jgi:hypothetical protein
MADLNLDAFDKAVKEHKGDLDLSAFDQAHNNHLDNAQSDAGYQFQPDNNRQYSGSEIFAPNMNDVLATLNPIIPQALQDKFPSLKPDMKKLGPVTGMKQGLTLGFGDEIAALSGAAGAKYGGDKRDFMDVYRDVLNSVRQEQKNAVDQSDGENFAGELVGGALLPAGLFGKGAAESAGVMAKAGNLAKIGGRAGAVIGLGNSTADLTSGEPGQIGQAIDDTAKSAAGGAIVAPLAGGALDALIGGTKAVGRTLGKIGAVKDVGEVFDRASNGEQISGNLEKFSEANRQKAKDIIDDLRGLRQMSGKFMEQHGDDLEGSNITVKIKDTLNGIRDKINKLKPVDKTEISELEDFKGLLGRALDEQEQTVSAFIPKPELPKVPKMGNEEKALNSITKRTAEAEAKDQIKLDQLNSLLEAETAKSTPNPAKIDAINNRIRKLQPTTNFPPENLTDDVTGMPVLGVDRGINKSPITSAVMPDAVPAEPVFTPIKRLDTTSTVQNTDEVTPNRLDEILSGLKEAKEKATTRVAKQSIGDTKTALENQLSQAIDATPGAKDISDAQEAASQAVHHVANTQEMLGIPRSVSVGPGTLAERTQATNSLQNIISKFADTSTKNNLPQQQTTREALSELGKAFPGSAERIQREMHNGSRLEYLANQMEKNSPLSRSGAGILATAKAAVLRGSEAIGQGVHNANSASGKLVELGKNVYDQSPEAIQMMADAAEKSGKTFAGVLSKIAGTSAARRKAMLFTLMQQPDFREFADGLVSPNSEENKKPGE